MTGETYSHEAMSIIGIMLGLPENTPPDVVVRLAKVLTDMVDPQSQPLHHHQLRRYIRWTDEMDELIRTKRGAKVSIGDIADELGVPYGSISNRIAKLGLREGKRRQVKPEQE